MAVLSMSDGKLRRLEVLRDVDRSSVPVRTRAALLDNALAAVNDVRGMLLYDEFSRSNWRERDDKPASVALLH